MNKIIITYPGNERMATLLLQKPGFEAGRVTFHRFPDKETLPKIETEVKDREVVVLCTLNDPDPKFLPLYFLTNLIRDKGARKITLVVPYLPYLRQDKEFNKGEAITSLYFAQLLSGCADELVTIDPHLHRYKSLEEIYTMRCINIAAAGSIGKWIKATIEKPLIIGPDSESDQWVKVVSDVTDAPCVVLEKQRHGDHDVEISVPELDAYADFTPVLVDDIASTARTMIETIKLLSKRKIAKPVCCIVHPVFSGNAYQELLNAGPERVISCNTIEHHSNGIDISDLIADHLLEKKIELH